jgi:hypothetical protein
MMRHFSFVAAILPMLASAARGADSIWLEGEEPTTKNVEVKAVGAGRNELLSGGKWLLLQIEQQDVPKKLPKEGARLGYQFPVSTAGNYEVWSRIGWEGIRSPFDWRIDQGPWRSIKPDYPTTDHVELAFWCPLGWMKLGETDLAVGRHTLEFRLSAWSKQENGKDVAQGIMFACDATCLARGPFRPNGKHRPDEDWQDAKDKQAARQVFKAGSGERGASRRSGSRRRSAACGKSGASTSRKWWTGPDRPTRCPTSARSSGWGPTCPATSSRIAPSCRFATG